MLTRPDEQANGGQTAASKGPTCYGCVSSERKHYGVCRYFVRRRDAAVNCVPCGAATPWRFDLMKELALRGQSTRRGSTASAGRKKWRRCGSR
jgi:hypothetical protein